MTCFLEKNLWFEREYGVERQCIRGDNIVMAGIDFGRAMVLTPRK